MSKKTFLLIIAALWLLIYTDSSHAQVVSCPKLGHDFIQAVDKAMPGTGGVECNSLHKAIVLLYTIKSSCDSKDAADAAELLTVIPQVYELKCVNQ